MKSMLECPGSPNCVSSIHENETRRVPPLTPNGPDPMGMLAAIVHTFPRSRIEVFLPNTLHATFRSFMFGFVDDFLALYDPDENRIDVKMGARTGWWDLGVNRRRMKTLADRYERGWY